MLLVNILLALAWAALTGKFTPLDLVFGFFLGALILYAFTRGTGSQAYFRRGGLIVEFTLYFLKELVIANLRLMITILSPRMKLRPGVVEISLDLREDIPIVLLVNLISLTPGTLGLDVASDRSAYFVHTLWLDDPKQFEANIKNGFERRIQEIFEK